MERERGNERRNLKKYFYVGMNFVDCCGKACWTEDWQYLNISIATPISISISNQTWSDQCPSSLLSENSNAFKLSHKCATTTVLRLDWNTFECSQCSKYWLKIPGVCHSTETTLQKVATVKVRQKKVVQQTHLQTRLMLMFIWEEESPESCHCFREETGTST